MLPVDLRMFGIRTKESEQKIAKKIKIFIFYLLPNESSLLTLISATRMQSLPYSSEYL